MARMSIACIDKPEFINLTPCNPLISECEIKVLYVGENRNRSYISKEVATQMANSLPGCPIVGYFKEDKQDFADHGDRVVIDDTGLHFECMTRPYGFVAPDAKVWFQKFEDTDEFGNVEVREYLMTTGYLWTGQYPECQPATEEGRPQSMELNEDSLDGKWAMNNKKGVEFFIINDALFSKLCILGDDVEPCFEGSKITKPEVSASFTKVDNEFTQTLFNMMQDLKFALKGEQEMIQDKFEKESVVEIENPTDGSAQTSFAESKKEDEEEKKEQAPSNEEKDSDSKEEDEEKKKNFVKKEEEDEDKSSEEDEEKKKFVKKEDEEKEVEDKEDKSSENKDEEDEEKKKFALLEQEHNDLLEKFSALEAQNKELLAFKQTIEDEKKDSLINSFYMLSDEDKKEVVENKSKYTLDEIEAKLSVICVRNKVNFDLDDASKNHEEVETPVTTFNLEEQTSSAPAWIAALKNTRDSRNV